MAKAEHGGARRRTLWVCGLGMSALFACGDDPTAGGFPGFDAGSGAPFETPFAHQVDPFDVVVSTPAEMPDPIYGGTLTPALSGDLALAAEPARDRLHVVDLRELGHGDARRARLDLAEGDDPWRSVAVPGGWLVSLRGGAMLRVDSALEEQWRTSLPAPRGVAVAGEVAWVATAGGLLVERDLESGEERARHTLPSDLRDVVAMPDGSLFVSRFHSAEVLKVLDGAVVNSFTPPERTGTKTRVAWRLAAASDHRLMLLTQVHGLGTIDNRSQSTARDPSRPPGYGAAAPPPAAPDIPEPLGAVVPQILTFDMDFEDLEKVIVPVASLVVDVAVFGTRFLVADTGGHAAHEIDGSGNVMTTIEAPPVADLPEGRGRYGARGLVTAVAFDATRRPLVQTAGDSQLRTPEGPQALSDTPLFDGGRVLFHERQESGLACASCHPEGGDDGHVWTFAVGGPRRTQPLGGGLADSAPFHWDGSIPSLTAIVRHNMNLMGGLATDPQVEAVMHWMESIPVQTGIAIDEAEEAHGEAVFEDAGCASCHSGERLSDGRRHRLRGTVLDTPSLRGVGVRNGLFHDGCVPDVASFGTVLRCRDGVHDLDEVLPGDRDALLRYVSSR